MLCLVVDDNHINRFILKKFLEKSHCTVIQSEDGDVAVGLCKLTHFDFIFLDFKMPRLSGPQTCSKIREFNKSSKIIGVTAHVDKITIVEAMKKGFDQIISKPFTIEDIKRIVRKN